MSRIHILREVTGKNCKLDAPAVIDRAGRVVDQSNKVTKVSVEKLIEVQPLAEIVKDEPADVVLDFEKKELEELERREDLDDDCDICDQTPCVCCNECKSTPCKCKKEEDKSIKSKKPKKKSSKKNSKRTSKKTK